MTDLTDGSELGRAEAVARAKVLSGRGRRAKAGDSTSARILVTGIVASATLVMVGAMAASARTTPATAPQPVSVIERIVTIEVPAPVLEAGIRPIAVSLQPVEILAHVWDFAFDGSTNIVEVYVSSLRKKIDTPYMRKAIETVRGAGYRLARDGG